MSGNSKKENLSEASLSLFIKFIMVCEDRVAQIEEALDDLGYNWNIEGDNEYEALSGGINHYLYLYKDIKNHTGLDSKVLNPKLKQLLGEI